MMIFMIVLFVCALALMQAAYLNLKKLINYYGKTLVDELRDLKK